MKGEKAVGKSNPLGSWKVLTKHRVRLRSDDMKTAGKGYKFVGSPCKHAPMRKWKASTV